MFKAAPIHYPSNITSAPHSLANISSSRINEKCVGEQTNTWSQWYCSCSSVVESHKTPKVVFTTFTTYGDTWDASLRRFPIKSIWSGLWTTSVLDPSYTPPEACCPSCSIVASDVQVLYWPVETGSNVSHPITTAPFSQYTLTSNGFEL